ncbi:MAG: hypothetical protein IJD35_06645 [Clostridia bacterium]|nr:hypothetical protein [Clostridia bacterium]
MTQSEFLQDAIGMIDESLVETALMTNPKPRRRAVFFAVAACLTVMLLAIPVGILFANRTETPEVPIVDTTSVVSTQTALPPITTSPLPITSIGTTQSSPVLIIPEQYQALYLPGAMNGIGSSAGAYSGALLQGTKEYKKTNVAKQIFTVFETSGEYKYNNTRKTILYPYDVDVFMSSSSEVHQNAETGEIVWFYSVANPQKLSNCPIFTSESSESDYIAYAKSILSDLISESLDQYMVTVKTSRIHDGIKESTYYRISFAKTISGIPCRGEYVIGIFEDGSFGMYSLKFNKEGFAPFEKLVIDKEKLDQIVMANYEMDTASLNVFSHESPEHWLYVEDGVLWAQSSIEYRYWKNDVEWVGEHTYMIKLAEVQR